MVVDKAGVLLYHPSFTNIDTASVNERHLAEMVNSLSFFLKKENHSQRRADLTDSSTLRKHLDNKMTL